MENGPTAYRGDKLKSNFEVLSPVERNPREDIYFVTLGTNEISSHTVVYGLLVSPDFLPPYIIFPLGDSSTISDAKLRQESYEKSTILGVLDDQLYRDFALKSEDRVQQLLGFLNRRSLDRKDGESVYADDRFYNRFGFKHRRVFRDVYLGTSQGGSTYISVRSTSRSSEKVDTVGLSVSERLLRYWDLLPIMDNKKSQVSKYKVRRQRAEWFANIARPSISWLNLDYLSVDGYLDAVLGKLKPVQNIK